MALRDRPGTTTPDAIPQIGSLLFSLPSELRNRIYDYIFAPKHVELVDGESAPIHLDTVANVPASDALLRTCRLAQQEIRGIFDRSPANPRFWADNKFVLNLADTYYNEFALLREESKRDPLYYNGSGDENPRFADFLADWPYTPDIYLELGDKQLNAMKRLILSVKTNKGSCEAYLIARTHRYREKYWHLSFDKILQTTQISPTLPKYNISPVRR